MRWLDLPPVWLLICLVLTWFSPWMLPWGASFLPGIAFLVIAAALTLAAVLAFVSARTTIIPHQTPDAMITSGVFRLTRNPIYLADVLILAGLALIWGKVTGVVLVPVLIVVLNRRFIEKEEARLVDTFGAAFEEYAARTRRWL